MTNQPTCLDLSQQCLSPTTTPWLNQRPTAHPKTTQSNQQCLSHPTASPFASLAAARSSFSFLPLFFSCRRPICTPTSHLLPPFDGHSPPDLLPRHQVCYHAAGSKPLLAVDRFSAADQ